MIHEIQHTAQQHNNNSSISEGYGMSQNHHFECPQATFESLSHATQDTADSSRRVKGVVAAAEAARSRSDLPGHSRPQRTRYLYAMPGRATMTRGSQFAPE